MGKDTADNTPVETDKAAEDTENKEKRPNGSSFVFVSRNGSYHHIWRI